MSELGKITAVDGRYSLTVGRHFPKPPAEVWAVLTEPAHLEVWLASVRYEPVVGARIEIDFGGGQTITGEVLEFEPPRVFAFTWREKPGEDEPSVVRFELAEDAGGTRFTLTHTRQAAAMARGTAGGWHAQLALLEGHLGGERLEWDDVYAKAKALYASAVEGIVD